MISSTVRKAIAQSVEELIDMIQEEEIEDDHGVATQITKNPSITEIWIKTDPSSTTHWVVFAGFGEGEYYKYAIYINKETGHTETDGY